MLWLLVLGGLLALRRRRRAATWCIVPALAIAVLATMLPIGAWLLQPLEDRFPPADAAILGRVDGIVVLGGALDPRVARPGQAGGLNRAADRITAMVALMRRYPAARVVFTGGSGNPFDQSYREADSLRPILAALGVDTNRIVFERESRNTVENARFSRRLAKPAPGQRWLLVTSAAHMPRAVGVFRRQGWPVIAYPVDYNAPAGWTWRGPYSLSHGLGYLDAAAKEWIGLAGYRLLGYTSSLLPGPPVAPQKGPATGGE